ncbi:MAG: hypothetical protein R2703_15375 [Micropruina glycogenica]
MPDTADRTCRASLERLLKAGMAKDPGLRPASAMDFARSLQVIEQELRLPRTETVVVPKTWLTGGPRRRRRRDPYAGPPVAGRPGFGPHPRPLEDLRTRRRTSAVRG